MTDQEDEDRREMHEAIESYGHMVMLLDVCDNFEELKEQLKEWALEGRFGRFEQ